ncbi:MAG TPA: SDR family oxidoreductase [Luteibaculaceae bacterium]|nr:SDR family oxidoreductase [Luteibaculaceae bacterium]
MANRTGFNGKVVWITGASSGIGEALSKSLARQGAILYLSARSLDALENTARQCRDIGAQAHALPLDVTDSSAIKAAYDRIKNEQNKLDVLINNAGISSRGLVVESSMEVYRKVMEIDFFSTVEATKTVLPDMIQANSGRIIVISSLMGKFSTPYRSAYCAAKHALHGFYDSLRAEVFKHHIQIQLVCPGFVSTQIAYKALNHQGQSRLVNDESNKNGLPPDEFVDRLMPQLLAGKDEIVIGGKETRGVWVKRFAPALLNRIMRKFEPK